MLPSIRPDVTCVIRRAGSLLRVPSYLSVAQYSSSSTVISSVSAELRDDATLGDESSDRREAEAAVTSGRRSAGSAGGSGDRTRVSGDGGGTGR